MHFYHHFEDKENIYILLEYCSRKVSVKSAQMQSKHAAHLTSKRKHISLSMPQPGLFNKGTPDHICEAQLIWVKSVYISYLFAVTGSYPESSQSAYWAGGALLSEADRLGTEVPARARDPSQGSETW